MAININPSYVIEDTSRTNQNNFSQPNAVASKILQLADPLFNKIKELSVKHLGSPTYLLVNQEDVVAKKVLKVSSWIFGISPTILLAIYVYDHLVDSYHQHFENYSRLEEKITADISNDFLEDSFEQIDILAPELLEEMKDSPGMSSPQGGIVHRIIGIWKGIKTFLANNAFTSSKPRVTNTVPAETEHKEPSYEDLKMLHPIREAYKNSNSHTIAENIAQIKADLPRMEIFVNGIHCSNIQEYISHLGFTLNEDETGLLQKDNPIVPKILNLVQQRSLNFSHNALSKHWQPLSVIPMMAHIENTVPIVRVNYTAEFPERCEITGETFFKILAVNKDGTGRGFLPYICKVKTKCSLDMVEISWELIEESSSKTANPVEEIEHTEEEFEELEAPLESRITNINHNWDIAFKHLKDMTNTCLSSTVTSEYLQSLKKKHNNTLVYEDRLMLPGSITIDEIVNLLNRLKNDNPTNQTIFLPFLVTGLTVDHAVVAVINLADETIEYFDPKGQSSIWFTRAEKQSNKNVFDFLRELGQKFISPTFSKEKIVYNKKNTPQGFFDNINCGVFCLQFIEERITRSFKDIENDLASDPKKLRRELANRIVENTHSNSI